MICPIMTALKTADILLLVCFCALLIGQTVGLKCYQCSSQSASQTCASSDGNDGNNENDQGDGNDQGDEGDDYSTTNTTNGSTKDGCTACDTETKTHKNGKVMYKRRCLEGQGQKAVDGCRFEGVNKLCTRVCYTDLCNTGPTSRSTLLSLLSILLVGLITRNGF